MASQGKYVPKFSTIINLSFTVLFIFFLCNGDTNIRENAMANAANCFSRVYIVRIDAHLSILRTFIVEK